MLFTALNPLSTLLFNKDSCLPRHGEQHWAISLKGENMLFWWEARWIHSLKLNRGPRVGEDNIKTLMDVHRVTNIKTNVRCPSIWFERSVLCISAIKDKKRSIIVAFEYCLCFKIFHGENCCCSRCMFASTISVPDKSQTSILLPTRFKNYELKKV